MAISSSSDAELWRAQADKLYLVWLTGQHLSRFEHELQRGAELVARMKRTADGDQQVQNLLRATGDAACITHADHRPAPRKPRKPRQPRQPADRP